MYLIYMYIYIYAESRLLSKLISHLIIIILSKSLL